MVTKSKLQSLFPILAVTLWMIVAPSPANAAEANSTRVTKFRVDGLSAQAFLYDENTGLGGFIFVAEDQINKTVSVDFSFVVPHPTDPDLVYDFQGAGQVPITSVTFTSTSAHLSVTTPESFPVYRCELNIITGEYNCLPYPPLTFDLTWVRNGFTSVYEKTKRTESFGPVTTKYEAEFVSHSALVSGTYGDYSRSNMSGTLYDTQNKSFIREVTMQLNP